MTSGNGIFRDFQRDHRTLSAYLQQTFAVPPLQAIWRYTSEELAKPTGDIVMALIGDFRVDGPQLQGTEITHSVSGGGELRPGNERGVRVSTNRHLVAIQVSGDIGLLEYWPDRARTDLRPVDAFDADPWSEDDDNAPYDEEAAILRHHQRQAQKLWWIGHKSPDGPLLCGLSLT